MFQLLLYIVICRYYLAALHNYIEKLKSGESFEHQVDNNSFTLEYCKFLLFLDWCTSTVAANLYIFIRILWMNKHMIIVLLLLMNTMYSSGFYYHIEIWKKSIQYIYLYHTKCFYWIVFKLVLQRMNICSAVVWLIYQNESTVLEQILRVSYSFLLVCSKVYDNAWTNDQKKCWDMITRGGV